MDPHGIVDKLNLFNIGYTNDHISLTICHLEYFFMDNITDLFYSNCYIITLIIFDKSSILKS